MRFYGLVKHEIQDLLDTVPKFIKDPVFLQHLKAEVDEPVAISDFIKQHQQTMKYYGKLFSEISEIRKIQEASDLLKTKLNYYKFIEMLNYCKRYLYMKDVYIFTFRGELDIKTINEFYDLYACLLIDPEENL